MSEAVVGCCCGNRELTSDEQKLEAILAKWNPDKKDSLITVLQETQTAFGYLPRFALRRIGQFYSIPNSKIYGVATFYNMFRLEPQGEHLINVCRGTACHVRGSNRILQVLEGELGIKDGQTTKDGKFTLETVACIGACGLAPVITIDEEAYGRLTPDMLSKIIKKYK